MEFAYVCVAGTFDGIHKGHEALLERAFAVGEKVLIGLTSDEYILRYKSPTLRTSQKMRKEALVQWLARYSYLERATIVSIDDPFEPAASDPELNALVVSSESQSRGNELNALRVRRGLRPLTLVVVPLVPAEDRMPISARRIRRGEITAAGSLIMPDALRDELGQPLGRVLFGSTLRDVLSSYAGKGASEDVSMKHPVIITVGDVTTKTFVDRGIIPNLMIVDNKVNREAFSDLQPYFAAHQFPTIRVKSGPGYISDQAVMMISKALHAQSSISQVIEVDGEEDLLALVAIREAPLHAVVYYGQPPLPAWSCGPIRKGVVEVAITSENQKIVIDLLQKFVHNKK